MSRMREPRGFPLVSKQVMIRKTVRSPSEGRHIYEGLSGWLPQSLSNTIPCLEPIMRRKQPRVWGIWKLSDMSPRRWLRSFSQSCGTTNLMSLFCPHFHVENSVEYLRYIACFSSWQFIAGLPAARACGYDRPCHADPLTDGLAGNHRHFLMFIVMDIRKSKTSRMFITTKVGWLISAYFCFTKRYDTISIEIKQFAFGDNANVDNLY